MLYTEIFLTFPSTLKQYKSFRQIDWNKTWAHNCQFTKWHVWYLFKLFLLIRWHFREQSKQSLLVGLLGLPCHSHLPMRIQDGLEHLLHYGSLEEKQRNRYFMLANQALRPRRSASAACGSSRGSEISGGILILTFSSFQAGASQKGWTMTTAYD